MVIIGLSSIRIRCISRCQTAGTCHSSGKETPNSEELKGPWRVGRCACSQFETGLILPHVLLGATARAINGVGCWHEFTTREQSKPRRPAGDGSRFQAQSVTYLRVTSRLGTSKWARPGHTPRRKGPAMVSLSSTRLTPGVSSTRVRNARCWSAETTSPQSSTTPSFTATLM
jgi:hypothetical protein